MAENPATATDEAGQPAFNIEKLYIKNASLEVPHAPEVFRTRTQPELDIKIAIASRALEDGFYEVSLHATLTATLEETKEKNTMFLVEVVSAGIFLAQNFPTEALEVLLNVTCPNILFPYAREEISNLVTRAGFMPVYLAPLNFDEMYRQQREAMAQQEVKNQA